MITEPTLKAAGAVVSITNVVRVNVPALPAASVTVTVGVYDAAPKAAKLTTLVSLSSAAVSPVNVNELVIVPASLLPIVACGVVSFDGVETTACSVTVGAT